MNTATATAVPQHEARDPEELLGRFEIAQPPYKIPVATQISWERINAYGWRDISIRVGTKICKRRRDLDAWLESCAHSSSDITRHERWMRTTKSSFVL